MKETIDCPYGKMELTIAMLSLEKKLPQDKLEQLSVEINKLNPSESSVPKTKIVAEFHGIPVEVLVNSHNYKTLVMEYEKDWLNRVITKMMEHGLDHKEAWALFSLVSHPEIYS